MPSGTRETAAGGTAADIATVTLRDDRYPPPLREIPDPPPVLFYRGVFLPWTAPAVAIVGARKASPYGVRVARALGADLAASGWVVVSGMAQGIDAAAHAGAMEAGGRTVAVLGSGVDRPYPSFHAALMDRIIAAGAVVSEFPPGSAPIADHFPRRNRIIAGLSLGVVVVEAGEKSGALITAQLAAEQGREVLAVPGPVDAPTSRGCNLLLKQGACLVEKGADILDLWPYLSTGSAAGVSRRARPGKGGALVALLRTTPLSAEEVAEQAGLPLAEALAALGALEIEGSVTKGEGGRYYA